MDRKVDAELIRYRSMREWVPAVGDVIIKHGWIFRTKWFGVINFVRPDGTLDIIKDGMLRLLVTTAPDSVRKKAITIVPDVIRAAAAGSYAVMQYDPNNSVVWYV